MYCYTYQVALSSLPIATDILPLINTVRHAMSISPGIGVSSSLSIACHAKLIGDSDISLGYNMVSL